LDFPHPVASGRFTGSFIGITMIKIRGGRRNFVSILSRSRVMPWVYFNPSPNSNVRLKNRISNTKVNSQYRM